MNTTEAIEPHSQTDTSRRQRSHREGMWSWIAIAVILAAIVLTVVISDTVRNEVVETWDVLSSGNQQQIRDHLHRAGAWGPVVSVVLMTAQVVLAPIPASVVQLANGVVFGIPFGSVLNLIGQMAGAAAAFFISRFLGQRVAERFVGHIDRRGAVGQWLHRHGPKALFLVRAIPGMPSDFVSYLMGLTSMPARTYLIVSLLGYIPQSIAYAWLGDQAGDWFWWIILGGFAISAVIAFVVWLVQRRHASAHSH